MTDAQPFTNHKAKPIYADEYLIGFFHDKPVYENSKYSDYEENG